MCHVRANGRSRGHVKVNVHANPKPRYCLQPERMMVGSDNVTRDAVGVAFVVRSRWTG